jgi:hypothetical protein
MIIEECLSFRYLADKPQKAFATRAVDTVINPFKAIG